MEKSVKKVIKYTLILNDKEAAILRTMIQNPVRDNESVEENKLRSDLYHALEP
jgi:hypothetical protein